MAKVAVSKAIYAIDKPYDYLVPPELEGQVLPGMRVAVPFGSGNRGSDGIVLSLERQEENTPTLKPVLSCLDDAPVLDEKGIQLALWMRERYFCTVSDAVKAMLPAGMYFALRDSVTLVPGLELEQIWDLLSDAPAAARLAEMLCCWGGSGDMTQIHTAFGAKDPTPAIRVLLDRKIAVLETSAQRAVGDKTERLAVLNMPAEEAMELVASRRKRAPLRYAVTELLCTLGAASTKELCYFTGASPATLRSLEKSGILTLEKHEVLRRVRVEDVEPAGPVELNQEQEAAFRGLDRFCLRGEAGAALLYGVTGSGKTQIYIRLIQEVLARGQTAMVLVPEISLTPQLLRVFASHFGELVAVLHSSLRSGERYDEWKRVRSGAARVVLGTRSAVFAPLDHIGLIVLDEEQESSYKSENAPRYHARDVAKYRCVQHRAVLLLGSATPAVESMYHAREGRYRLFTLSQRFNQQAMPQVRIVDMKRELRAGNCTAISAELRRELACNLERGEQSILFLNRRGSSRMVSCGECGQVPECPRCSVRLTYHSANGRLMCHYCGFSQRTETFCPECGGQMKHVGTGTQKAEEELKALFPNAAVLRMDADTVAVRGGHERILHEFKTRRVPILLGTQMVAKGLDFENVTLVGVLAADLTLYMDHYCAAERTFSLLTQVIGRAGRGEKGGRAVIQTYTPENEVLQCAAHQDYDRFYRSEIRMRRLHNNPPFADLFTLVVSGADEGRVLRASAVLRDAMKNALQNGLYQNEPIQVVGPAPAPVAKVNNCYRYHVYLVAKNHKTTRAFVEYYIKAFSASGENRGVHIFVNCNAMN